MIRFYALGDLRLEPSGRALSSRRKSLALLAYLASRSGRPMRRTELAALFWGDRDEERARHSLRQVLLELRQCVGGILSLDREYAVLNRGGIEVDAQQFEHAVAAGEMESALALWGGDFLPGADEIGTEVFRAWLEGERERLRRYLVTALGQLVSDAQNRGCWDEAVHWSTRWTVLLPLDERGHAHVISALRMQGRLGDAVAHHASAAALLARQLGRKPSAEFRRLGTVLEEAFAETSHVPQQVDGLRAPEMVGRSVAFGALAAGWRDAVKGSSVVVLIEGNAGIGKTRLSEEFLHWATMQAPPAFVLRASGAVTGGGATPDLVRELLEGLQVADGLGGASPEALARLSDLVPSLRARFPNLPEHAPDSISAVASAVEAVGAVAEETPLVLFVDDFERTEEASQQFIVSLAQRLPGRALLLLSSATNAEAKAASLLRAVRELRRVKLQPLLLPEVDAVLASMLVLDEAERHRIALLIHTESGGNPLHVVELVGALVTQGHVHVESDGRWRVNPAYAEDPLALPSPVLEAIRSRLNLTTNDPRRPRRFWTGAVAASVAVAAIATIIVATLLLRAPPEPTRDPDRVVVATFDNRTGDTSLDRIGTMTADFVVQGLVQTGLVDVADPLVARGISHSALARQTRSGILISGSYYLQHDSLSFQARIVDEPSEKILRAVDPILVPRTTPLSAVPILSRHVMASLATVVNPRLRSWAGAVTQPPSFEAYEEYAEGLESFVREQWSVAAAHFDNAARTDATFHMAAISALRAHSALGDTAAVDSIAHTLERVRSSLLPYERAILDRSLAEITPDLEAHYRTAKAVAALMPASDEAVNALAIAALQINHPKEAIRLFEKLDPSQGAIKDWTYYWWALTSAYHLAGDYRGELEAARRGIRQYPDVMAMRTNEVRALAALGHIDELKERIEAALTLPVSGSYYQGRLMTAAAVELRRHGYLREAQDVLALSIAWYDGRVLDNPHLRYECAYTYYVAGRYAEARHLFEGLLREEPKSAFYSTFVALAAARMGDTVPAREVSERLRRTQPPVDFGEFAMRRSQMEAVLGNHDRAIDLIGEALRRGAANTLQIHTEIDFESLRNYARFRDLIDPKG
jgi:DNA-binding SARP family transcriptional activator/tetratricopeptide (TPR) repeat protein